LVLLLVLAGLYGFLALKANREVEDAVAEIERVDPRWQLDDIEADRTVLPEKENSAFTAMGVKPMMPDKWPIWQIPQPANEPNVEEKRDALDKSFAELEPQRQLNEEQIEILRAELVRASRALDKARTLADKPEGRYPITYSADFIGTLLPYLQDTRQVGSLLANDVLLQAQEKHYDRALTSCRAILNAGRSIGDEPLLISQLVRYALRSIAVNKIQRTLAQGEPSEAALGELQRLLEKEEAEPLLLIAVRGERAGMDRLLEGIQSGKLPMSGKDLAMAAGLSGSKSPPVWMQTQALRLPSVRTWQRAAMLRHMTRAVEIAKMPLEQQEQEMEQLDAAAKTQPLLVRLLCPAIAKVAAADRRIRVELRCAFVAVAAERYRQTKKKWPASLEALREAGYLAQIPMDLYDGQPLRMRRTDEGLLIYSVGPDGQDNGGHIDRTDPLAKGTDRVFHLWDVSKRRQEAAPLKLPQPANGPGGPPDFGPLPAVPPAGPGK
jgi:hypothetical protein